ncbi:SMAD/FHA domain-containing protein [Pilobolus umbonatus]|nr:SMAD/FHA domain-containing protein [Pilobolus umbonatus]
MDTVCPPSRDSSLVNTNTQEQIPNSIHIKLIPNVEMTNRCFVFDVIDRDLIKGGSSLKLGRYSDRAAVPNRLSFKSKVVSRYHAEIWVSDDGKIYIKDSGSSSGTFVNHIRLTTANSESTKAHEIIDGDLIQLGVDYKGGIEPVYRSVKMRLEVNRREWREFQSNTYNLAAFQQLRQQLSQTTSNTKNTGYKEEVQECCICLYCIAPFQALFIAPCSHVYHYRCLRPLLIQNYPGFSCPLCRTYSNLEASVTVEESEVLEMLGLVENIVDMPLSGRDEGEDDIMPSLDHHYDKTMLTENVHQAREI